MPNDRSISSVPPLSNFEMKPISIVCLVYLIVPQVPSFDVWLWSYVIMIIYDTFYMYNVHVPWHTHIYTHIHIYTVIFKSHYVMFAFHYSSFYRHRYVCLCVFLVGWEYTVGILYIIIVYYMHHERPENDY